MRSRKAVTARYSSLLATVLQTIEKEYASAFSQPARRHIPKAADRLLPTSATIY